MPTPSNYGTKLEEIYQDGHLRASGLTKVRLSTHLEQASNYIGLITRGDIQYPSEEIHIALARIMRNHILNKCSEFAGLNEKLTLVDQLNEIMKLRSSAHSGKRITKQIEEGTPPLDDMDKRRAAYYRVVRAREQEEGENTKKQR